MIWICTKDAALVEACGRLSGDGEKACQLKTVESWQQQDIQVADLIIIDLKVFDEDSLPEINCPAVALAEVPVYSQAMRLMRRGARGYGNRYMQPENLVQAVAAVREGQVWMPPAIINRMISAALPAVTEPVEPLPLERLSKREREVAALVARGMSNKELAEKLFISVRTVKAHLTAIFSKTGMRDRLALAVRMKNH